MNPAVVSTITRNTLIGRNDELELLKNGFRSSLDGETRLILLAGEPGIGKSRLCEALSEYLFDYPLLEHIGNPTYFVLNRTFAEK